jgi:hypothetical protein
LQPGVAHAQEGATPPRPVTIGLLGGFARASLLDASGFEGSPQLGFNTGPLTVLVAISLAPAAYGGTVAQPPAAAAPASVPESAYVRVEERHSFLRALAFRRIGAAGTLIRLTPDSLYLRNGTELQGFAFARIARAERSLGPARGSTARRLGAVRGMATGITAWSIYLLARGGRAGQAETLRSGLGLTTAGALVGMVQARAHPPTRWERIEPGARVVKPVSPP